MHKIPDHGEARVCGGEQAPDLEGTGVGDVLGTRFRRDAPALIGAVTAEDVHRVARRLLREDAMTTVIVGQPVGLSEP